MKNLIFIFLLSLFLYAKGAEKQNDLKDYEFHEKEFSEAEKNIYETNRVELRNEKHEPQIWMRHWLNAAKIVIDSELLAHLYALLVFKYEELNKQSKTIPTEMDVLINAGGLNKIKGLINKL